MSAGARVADEVHHGEPGALRAAQDRRRARPGDRRRRGRRQRAAAARRRRRARLRRRARPRRLAASGARRGPDGGRARRRRSPSCRRRRPPRRTWRRTRAVRVASTLAEVRRRARRRANRGPTIPATTDGRRTSRRRPTWPTCAGQPVARRALEIAAAGGHHLLMVGSPGSGKTMLAQRLPRPAAAARPRRLAGGHDGPLGGRAWRCRTAGWSPRRRSGRRTTPAPRSPSSAAARPRCDRARSASPTAACCSSTSSASSRRPRSTGCASRWRRASSGSRGPTPGPCCRPGSCSSRPPTRARAAAARRGRASATTSPGCATSAGCPGRCSTASTCASPCSGPPSTICSTPAAASRARWSRPGSRPPGGSRSSRPGGSTPSSHGELLDRTRRCRAGALAVLRAEIERGPAHRARLPPGPAGGPHDRRPRSPGRRRCRRRRRRSTSRSRRRGRAVAADARSRATTPGLVA